MKKVWISYCTEHEFGQRPDGYMISNSLDALNGKIEEERSAGSSEQFWTHSTPMEVWCSKKTFKKIKERMTRTNYVNIAFFGNNEKLKLFKQL